MQGYQRISEGVGGWAQRLILPSVTLSVIYIALIARMTRTSVLEVLSEDYIRTARAKGQTERKVLFRHALRNAAVPIVTVIGLGVALLIGGVVVTESVFTIPGLGRLTVDAVLARDYPTIQAVILLFSFVYVMINLAVDMLYTCSIPGSATDGRRDDPRTRSPASPAKPARVSQLAAQSGRRVRRRRHRDRVADGGYSRPGSAPSIRPRSTRLRATRSPARKSRCGRTPANASR